MARKWDIAAGVAGQERIASTNRWTRAGNTAHGGISTTCVDTVAKHAYAIRAEDSPQPINFFVRWDFSAGTGVATLTNVTVPSHLNLARTPTGIFWTGPSGNDRYMLVFGGATSGVFEGPMGVRLYDLARLGLDNPAYADLALRGVVPGVGYGAGVCWCPDLNVGNGGVFFVYPNTAATIGKIYKVAPPLRNVKTNPWVWEELPLLTASGQTLESEVAASQDGGPYHGLWKRLQYATKARCIIFPSKSLPSGHMYAWTPPGL